MFETKCVKALMKYIYRTDSDKDGFYYGMDFQKQSRFSVSAVEITVSYLVKEGLLEQPFHNRPDVIKPTLKGLKYHENRLYKIRSFFLGSVLCPIGVSIATTLITIYISKLL